LQVGVRQAIKIADRVLLLERGRVALQGPAGEMARRLDEIEAGHLWVVRQPARTDEAPAESAALTPG
jgi:ABC-type multidrug transport system ATPase subunit